MFNDFYLSTIDNRHTQNSMRETTYKSSFKIKPLSVFRIRIHFILPEPDSLQKTWIWIRVAKKIVIKKLKSTKIIRISYLKKNVL